MDGLVKFLFDAIKNQDVTPRERHEALIRAGKIAESYNHGILTPALAEEVFGKATPSALDKYKAATSNYFGLTDILKRNESTLDTVLGNVGVQ